VPVDWRWVKVVFLCVVFLRVVFLRVVFLRVVFLRAFHCAGTRPSHAIFPCYLFSCCH
jgi:hypothetical protein